MAMPYTRTILCLAKSRKHGGYCFAGKDVESGEWIRPVSNRPDEEILRAECTRPNGSEAELLDILEIPFLRAKPQRYQTENHLIDPTGQWKKRRTGTWRDVEEALDDHRKQLWYNERGSWGYSSNRVREALLGRINDSLRLIQPKALKVSIGLRGGSFPNAKDRLVRAHFSHTGIDYTLQITDPVIERRFRAGADRTEDMTGVALCVSLGEVYKGYAYKLVAAVIRP